MPRSAWPCHGDAGKGGVAPFYPALIGGAPLHHGIETQKTIANYYAYPTTVFDYTRRAMPYNAPRSLSDTEVYALTAYILSLNKLIGEERRDGCQILAAGEDAHTATTSSCRIRIGSDGSSAQASLSVMPALVAGIHVFRHPVSTKTWMAGTSPAMTLSVIQSMTRKAPFTAGWR